MITGYFGLPGSGKTTFLTMIAQKELKLIEKGKGRYERVFTNFYCKGCYQIKFSDLGKYNILNSLILLDEITLDADSRDFKTFTHEKKEFFLLHRHYNCDIVYFTQQWDGVDKKIRDITSDLFYVKKSCANLRGVFRLFQPLSIARRVFRTLEINEYTKEIVNGYRFPSLFEKFFGGHTKQFCFRPKWYKYFDSWDKPISLPDYEAFPWLCEGE